MSNAPKYRRESDILIIGGGTMGMGFAAAFLNCKTHKYRVHVYDNFPPVRDAAFGSISDRFDLLGKYGQLNYNENDMHGRFHVVESRRERDKLLRSGLYLVLEAVPEDIDIKYGVLADASEIVSPNTLLLTNTSALPPDLLIRKIAKEHQRHFAVTHGTNPPFLRKAPIEYGLAPGVRSKYALAEARYVAEMLSDNTVHAKNFPAPINTMQFYVVLRAADRLFELIRLDGVRTIPIKTDYFLKHAETIDNAVLGFLPFLQEKGVFSGEDPPRAGGLVDYRDTKYMWESLRLGAQNLLDRGTASKEDIEMIAQMHRIRWGALGGVFGVITYGGVDVFAKIVDNLQEMDIMRGGSGSLVLDTLVEAGYLGIKCEKGGFYSPSLEEIEERKSNLIQGLLEWESGKTQ